jgi:two-component system phosphate regulon sensor histidine kinase PhoR
MAPVDMLLLFLVGLVVILLIKLQTQRKRLQNYEFDQPALQRDLLRAREQLSITERRMMALANATYDVLLTVDKERRIIAINRSARDLFPGIAEPIGQTVMAVTRHHELDALVANVLNGEMLLETQIELNDRSFRVRCMLIDSDVRLGAALALQDISELLRLTRARRDMVANFSHDLRTPIRSIRLLVDTLTTNFGRNPERDSRLLGKIAGETDSLQHMTQELIDLSMIESGRAIIRMVTVNLKEILTDASNLMATQIEQKKLDLVNEITDDIQVLIDPEQTRRVITNVIHNAVKFTPRDGQIRLSAACADQMVTLRIRDTGPGIPPQERTRIFERFYQVDTSRTGQSTGSGSGLGLSIAKHIIEAQGGKIWAEAGIPSGACIAFTIPLADPKK